MDVVAKLNIRQFQEAATLDVHPTVTVDQNIRDGRVRQKGFQRPEPKYFVEDFLTEALPFLEVHGGRFPNNQLFQNLFHFSSDFFAVNFGELVEIQLLNKATVNRVLYRGEVSTS